MIDAFLLVHIRVVARPNFIVFWGKGVGEILNTSARLLSFSAIFPTLLRQNFNALFFLFYIAF